MPNLVLVGTCHSIQRNLSRSDFSEYISSLIENYKIAHIAEEIDSPATLSTIATSHNIGYTIIEPNHEERRALEIQSLNDIDNFIFMEYDDISSQEAKSARKELVSNSHQSREKEWLNRICRISAPIILVVCGANHFDSFSSLLASNGFHVIKECPLWE